MVISRLPERIVLYPDPRLRQKCAPFERVDDSVAALARRMLELMKADHGVGLAGPQVGVCRRIIVANPTGEPGDDRVYINPVLSELVGQAEAEEGCLSLPDIRVRMVRARCCRVAALDVTGQPFEENAEGLLARILQHETDHLDGRLIIDRMNPTDRLSNKKQIAQLEADYRKVRAKVAR